MGDFVVVGIAVQNEAPAKPAQAAPQEPAPEDSEKAAKERENKALEEARRAAEALLAGVQRPAVTPWASSKGGQDGRAEQHQGSEFVASSKGQPMGPAELQREGQQIVLEVRVLTEQIGVSDSALRDLERIERIEKLVRLFQKGAFEFGERYDLTDGFESLRAQADKTKGDSAREDHVEAATRLSTSVESRSEAIKHQRNLARLEFMLEEPEIRADHRLREPIEQAAQKLRAIVDAERESRIQAELRLGRSGSFAANLTEGERAETGLSTTPPSPKTLNRAA